MKAIVKKDCISLVTKNNKVYTINSDHINFSRIEKMIKSNTDEEKIIKVLNEKPVKTIKSYSLGEIKVVGDKAFIDNKEIPKIIVDKIIEFKKKNIKFDNIIKFVKNVLNNKDEISLSSLFSFIERNRLIITPQGDILFYKYLNSNYKDQHTNSFDNRVGKTVTMERRKCCTSIKTECGPGLHVACYDFVKSRSTVVIVRVNPIDIVSVPMDCNFQKVRCCKYVVVKDWSNKKCELTHDVMDENGNIVDKEKLFENNAQLKSGRKWQKFEDEYILKYKNKIDLKTMAEKIQRSVEAIRKRFAKIKDVLINEPVKVEPVKTQKKPVKVEPVKTPKKKTVKNKTNKNIIEKVVVKQDNDKKVKKVSVKTKKKPDKIKKIVAEPGSKWSQEEINLVHAKYTAEEISKINGRSVEACKKMIRKLTP